MADVNLNITLELVEQLPEGDKCVICGDICWLKQYRLFVVGGNVARPSNVIICQSCRDNEGKEN
jgi:hypothetical protein